TVQGVLAAWLNQLSETQRVSIGPWDRLRIGECPGRPDWPCPVAEAWPQDRPRAVARRQVRPRPEHTADHRLPWPQRGWRPAALDRGIGRAHRQVPDRGPRAYPADAPGPPRHPRTWASAQLPYARLPSVPRR